jgi:hypothetical protein
MYTPHSHKQTRTRIARRDARDSAQRGIRPPPSGALAIQSRHFPWRTPKTHGEHPQGGNEIPKRTRDYCAGIHTVAHGEGIFTMYPPRRRRHHT